MEHCPECGGPLAADLVEGLCSKCLMAQGLELASVRSAPGPATTSPPLPRCLGDYELIEEIARGGMGVVYRARQGSLDRTVAVKLLHFGPHASPDQVRRFRAEATAAAGLQHSNIVAIHEVGVHQGEQYLVMDLVDGPNLAGFVKDQPLPALRAAGYLRTVAEAIHYAHERGILHRDLKPSNVLIGSDDQPRVTDFGLAKQLEGDSSLTLSGQVLGSPSYMPPEQAGTGRGKVGRRSDVYALGAMLYHMLVARPPFVGEGLNQTLEQVFNSEPVAPRLLNPAVPRDLETICLKCMEKEPGRRYATARALADELGRVLRGESIQARPVNWAERLWRWCLRKPALASLILLVHLVGTTGLAGIVWQWRRAETRGDQLEAASAKLRRNAYADNVNLAQKALAVNNLGLTVELLDKHRPDPGEADQRGWEWRYLWRHSRSHVGMSVLCRQSNGIASLAASRDGQWLAVGEEEGGRVSVWDLERRREVARMTAGTSAALVAFSPREPLLVMVNGRGVSGNFAPGLQSTASLWRPTSRQPVASFPVGGACRRQILVSDDGETLVTSERDEGNSIRFRRLSNGLLLTNYFVPYGSGNPGPVWPVAITRDASAIACGVPGGGLHLVDRATLTKRWSRETEDEVVTLGFSPDGALLASGSGLGYTAISLWDVRSGEKIASLEGHGGWISALVFWSDGKKLASASGDQTIRLWDLTDLANVRPAGVLAGHKSEVWSLLLLPDDRTLISGSKDGSVCSWDTGSFGRGHDGVTTLARVSAWAFTPDSRSIRTVSPEGEMAQWRGADMGKEATLMTLPRNWASRFSPDARLVAAAQTRSSRVGVWDLEARAPVRERVFRDGSHPGLPLRFNTGGNRLLVAFANTDRIEEWDFVTDQITATWRSAVNHGAAFSRDERTCLVFRPNGDTALRELAGGGETALGLEFRQASDAAFSPDGRLLAGSSWLGWIRLWDTASWKELATLPGFLQAAYSVAFSPDGRRIVGGSDGREALRLWATDSFRDLLTLEGEGSGFHSLAFSPDGNTLTASNWNGLLHCWHAPSWDEIEAAEKSAQPTWDVLR